WRSAAPGVTRDTPHPASTPYPSRSSRMRSSNADMSGRRQIAPGLEQSEHEGRIRLDGRVDRVQRQLGMERRLVWIVDARERGHPTAARHGVPALDVTVL